jgi:hypothetical protein
MIHVRSRVKGLPLGGPYGPLTLRCGRVEGAVPPRGGGLSTSQSSMSRSTYIPTIAVLPQAPITGSPVPSLTSLYHKADRGPWGSSSYPGNCSGHLIRDLIRYFQPANCLDPMTGSGTAMEVCRELGVPCRSFDIHAGVDACDPKSYEGIGTFDFCFIHPPYARQKKYTNDLRDMSNAPTLDYFLLRYEKLILNCAAALSDNGKLAILMGDYSDREWGFVPLVYHTKRLAFEAGLKQACTDIIRFSHGASSGKKVYKSSFIPGLHDTCVVFERGPNQQRTTTTFTH